MALMDLISLKIPFVNPLDTRSILAGTSIRGVPVDILVAISLLMSLIGAYVVFRWWRQPTVLDGLLTDRALRAILPNYSIFPFSLVVFSTISAVDHGLVAQSVARWILLAASCIWVLLLCCSLSVMTLKKPKCLFPARYRN